MSNDSVWTETRRATLRAFCDTVFPSVLVDSDPYGFWARSACDLGVPGALEQAIDHTFLPAARTGTFALLDALASLRLADLEPSRREQLLLSLIESSPEAAVAVGGLVRVVISLCYTLPDATGRNPTWPAIGYPGPRAKAALAPKPIRPLVVEGDEIRLDADVCVVGSGAGGGVVAGELSARGKHVVVLEAGGYYAESDFTQLELWSHRNLYWRGGYTPTQDGNVLLIAGGTLGGGTQINWENCVRTPDWIRGEWAREHGLDGLDGPEFDAHLDDVAKRLLVNDRCSDLNGPHLRFEAGARRLGYRFARALRNVDPARYDPETAGFHGFGDVTGSRQSTVNTYLADAQAHGATILVQTRADRVRTEAGRVTSVEATAIRPDGRPARVIVRARDVVLTCGALETPALLLRSGLGGPAAGMYLRLHPCVGMTARYPEDQASWWGPPQAALCDDFLRVNGGHGFLIEGMHHNLGLTAAGVSWRSGRQHKQRMLESNRWATLIAIVRDHGWGRVVLDASGTAQYFYPADDSLDRANLLRGARELARVHEAAGAQQLRAAVRVGALEWERGISLESWLDELETAGPVPTLALFSAHQMGSARMGRDPSTSVAGPSGELHDVRGLWIGDTSAFPTAPGVNPMITCMALAARTAARIR